MCVNLRSKKRETPKEFNINSPNEIRGYRIKVYIHFLTGLPMVGVFTNQIKLNAISVVSNKFKRTVVC